MRLKELETWHFPWHNASGFTLWDLIGIPSKQGSLLVTSASLLVTSALLVITMFATALKFILIAFCYY